jgi:hypothetical protein
LRIAFRTAAAVTFLVGGATIVPTVIEKRPCRGAFSASPAEWRYHDSTATRLGTSFTVGGLLRVGEEVFSNPDS